MSREEEESAVMGKLLRFILISCVVVCRYSNVRVLIAIPPKINSIYHQYIHNHSADDDDAVAASQMLKREETEDYYATKKAHTNMQILDLN